MTRVADAVGGADATGSLPHFNPTRGVITIWSDIGCPWATLALHRLRRAIADDGGSVLIDHRAFPLELFNERPTPKAVLDAETAVIGSHEPTLRWRPWRARSETYPVTTLLALEAVQATKDRRVGGLAASAALDWALREAFYVDSRCISMLSEVLAVATDCPEVDADALAAALRSGRAREAVFADFAVARGADITGSPQVVLPDGTGVHNPGVENMWTRERGSGYPVIVSDDPSVWPDLVRRAASS
jgi:predicted DsbA family dithiol-disulfide isomerase